MSLQNTEISPMRKLSSEIEWPLLDLGHYYCLTKRYECHYQTECSVSIPGKCAGCWMSLKICDWQLISELDPAIRDSSPIIPFKGNVGYSPFLFPDGAP